MPSIDTWLSQLFEITLETTRSAYNKELRVVKRGRRLLLYAENAIYSADDLYINFGESFKKLDIAVRNPQDILILGYGLGSIPYIIEKKHKLLCNYTAVEIDDIVLRLAKKYSEPRLKSKIEHVHADAMTFVEECNDQFDMICMDIFVDDIIPEKFQQAAYLKKVSRLLRPRGVFLYNRLARNDEEDLDAERFYFHCFNPVFKDTAIFEIEGNKMLVAFKD